MPELEEAPLLTPERMVAFSDGVIAVIITIMVLDLKVPSTPDTHAALIGVGKLVLLYLLSFVQVGIYWVNHHYLMDRVERVSHAVLWSNLLFLFCLSLFPFATAWLGERGLHDGVQIYTIVSFLPALAWNYMTYSIQRMEPASASLTWKERLSTALYLGAIVLARPVPAVALALLIFVAVLWLLPPRRARSAR